MDFVKYNGGFWIRVFGYGLNIFDEEKQPKLFSLQNNFVRLTKIGKYTIILLVP